VFVLSVGIKSAAARCHSIPQQINKKLAPEEENEMEESRNTNPCSKLDKTTSANQLWFPVAEFDCSDLRYLLSPQISCSYDPLLIPLLSRIHLQING
jgi:hypothetical protein